MSERERISPDDSRQREERLRTNVREKDGDRQKCERARTGEKEKNVCSVLSPSKFTGACGKHYLEIPLLIDLL